MEDVLPNGPDRFPDDFLSTAARSGTFEEITLPEEPVRYAGAHFGQEQMATEGGQTVTVQSKFHVRYVLFAQSAGQTVVRIPKEPVEVSRAVNDYAHYLRDVRTRLRDEFFNRTLDQAAAERFVEDRWRALGLPDPDI